MILKLLKTTESCNPKRNSGVSTTADGMRETFALDSNIFDITNEEYHQSKKSLTKL